MGKMSREPRATLGYLTQIVFIQIILIQKDLKKISYI
jgi:hypothetical protein